MSILNRYPRNPLNPGYFRKKRLPSQPQIKSHGGTVKQYGETVEQSWWNTLVEQWNIHGRTLW